MPPLFLVMAGGALGAGARYLVGRALFALAGAGFPWGTLVVNLAGGLAMGLLAGFVARHGPSESVQLFAGVGILGGFTTFSAFGLDTVQLLARDPATALAYVLASVIGTVALVYAGASLVRVAA